MLVPKAAMHLNDLPPAAEHNVGAAGKLRGVNAKSVPQPV
jgi:hypothetical protein